MMKTLLAFSVAAALIAITGCSLGAAEACFTIFLYGCLAGFVLVCAYAWSRYIKRKEHRYFESKQWERERQEVVTEGQYDLQRN